MGIVNGTCTFRRFNCSQTNVDPFDIQVDRAALRYVSPDIDSMSDDKAIGWVTSHHLLDRDIKVEKILAGDWLLLVLRNDRRAVPESLVKAYVELEIDGIMRGGRMKVSKEERQELKDATREKLMKKTLPKISGTDMAWNMKTGEVFFATQSNTAMDAFVKQFRDTFGCEIFPADIREVVTRSCDDETAFRFADLLPTNYTNKKPALEPDGTAPLPLVDDFIGRECLTWLWFACEKNGGEFKLPDGTKIWIGIEDYLEFASGDREGQKSILRHGAPSSSAEALTALQAGRMLEKIRLTLSDGEQEWMFHLCADGVHPTSVKLPKCEERALLARHRERCVALSRLLKYLDGLFKVFLEIRVSEKDWESERTSLMKWVQTRLNG